MAEVNYIELENEGIVCRGENTGPENERPEK